MRIFVKVNMFGVCMVGLLHQDFLVMFVVVVSWLLEFTFLLFFLLLACLLLLLFLVHGWGNLNFLIATHAFHSWLELLGLLQVCGLEPSCMGYHLRILSYIQLKSICFRNQFQQYSTLGRQSRSTSLYSHQNNEMHKCHFISPCPQC